MRCLYCGNELALLKKLTGGGEFCSEAHRQKYQEEYNRLALTRLLQAQPPLAADRQVTDTQKRAKAEPAPRPAGAEAVPGPEPPVPKPYVPPPPPDPPRTVEPAPPQQPGFLWGAFSGIAGWEDLEGEPPFLAPIPAFLPTYELRAGAARLREHLEVVLDASPVSWNKSNAPSDLKLETRAAARMPSTLGFVPGLRPRRCLVPVAVTLGLSPSATALPWFASGRDLSISPEFSSNGRLMVEPFNHEVREQDLLLPSWPEIHDPELIEEVEHGADPDFGHGATLAHPWANGTGIAAPSETVPLPSTGPERSSEYPSRVVIDLSLFDMGDTSAAAVAPIGLVPAPVISPSGAAVEVETSELPEPVSAVEEIPSEASPVIEISPAPANEMVAYPKAGPFPIVLQPVFLGAAIPLEMNPPLPPTAIRLAHPVLESVPIRPKMVYGARPQLPVSVPVTTDGEASVEAVAPPVQAAEPEAGRDDQRRAARPVPDALASTSSATPASVEDPLPADQPETPAPQAPPPLVSRFSETQKLPPAAPPRADLELNQLRLTLEQSNAHGGGRGGGMQKAALAAGLIAALCLGGFLFKSMFSSKPIQAPATQDYVLGPSLINGAGGWSADWANAGPRSSQISIFRPSLSLADYRIEFQGQIETRSIGWIFRASNPKNYYANKIEITKPGLDPTVVLARYTVIDGQETGRVEKPLPFKVHLDTVYKVRTDVFGVEFQTFIQENPVDKWTDERFRTGGFGLLSSPGDRSQVRLIQLHELKPGK